MHSTRERFALEIRQELFGEFRRIVPDDHDRAERLGGIFKKIFAEMLRSENWRMDAVIGADTHESEAQRGRRSFFIGPFRAQICERHFGYGSPACFGKTLEY